jgi:hypothetical protein
MPSDTYTLIWHAARRRQQLILQYDEYPRECCPVVLGYKADGSETAFMFQFAGGSSDPSKLPNWRCLTVAKIRDLRARTGEWHEGKSHKQRQNCVDWIDVDVNMPDTLTREAPLPFGSPLLRRSRRG